MVRGDGVHQTACLAVQALADDWPKLLELFLAEKIKPSAPQKTSSRPWIGKEWRPEHLRVVYELYGKRVVETYLDGKLTHNRPKLVRQL